MTLLESNEVIILGFLLIILGFLYFWMRHGSKLSKLDRERKLRCKELILNNRSPLAEAGVDFDGLVSLVKMNITPEQLVKVIDLLTAKREHYNIDHLEDTDQLEVNLDIESSKATVVKKAEQKIIPEKGKKQSEISENMSPEQEKVWLRLVHSRYRKALSEKGINDRRGKFRLLAKMVELGKKTVEEDPEKTVSRKTYECALWDKFYENEYLELNSEGEQG
jgi:hypothetical protein